MEKFRMDHDGPLLPDGEWDDTSSYIDSLQKTEFSFQPVFLTLVFSLLFIGASLLNTLFLIIFFRKPSLRNISNRFIVSLTISNLVSSWVLLPLVVADVFLKDFVLSGDKDVTAYLKAITSSNALCTTFNVAADFTTSASVFCTVLIAFDRFYAITDPLHYHMLVTKCRSWFFIGLGWFLATIVATFSGMIGDGEGKWNVCEVRSKSLHEVYYWGHLSFGIGCFIVCFALPLIMLSWAYSKIYSAAQQNSERARRSSLCSPTLEVVDTMKSISRSSSTRSTSSQIVSTIRRRLSNASLFLYKEEARAAKISVGVVVLFLFCWFPYYLTKIIYCFLDEDAVPTYIFKIILILTLTNAIISPYVYMYRSKRIQREVLRLFGISTRARRGDFDRRRPVYQQLSANLERIPASPICIEGSFKLDSISQGESMPSLPLAVNERRTILSKIFRKSAAPPSALLTSSCISPSTSSCSSNCSAHSTSSCQTSCISTNIGSSTQNLSNLLTVKIPPV